MRPIFGAVPIAFFAGWLPGWSAAQALDDFPVMRCSETREFGGREAFSLWLHGFLSGINWSDPDVTEADLASYEQVRDRIAALCRGNPDALINGGELNRLYYFSRGEN